MSNLSGVAKVFLQELHSSKKTTFETLKQFAEALENKVDPEPTEVRLAEQIYNLFELLAVLEKNMRTYVVESDGDSFSSKLENLYENSFPVGSSNLFK